VASEFSFYQGEGKEAEHEKDSSGSVQVWHEELLPGHFVQWLQRDREGRQCWHRQLVLLSIFQAVSTVQNPVLEVKTYFLHHNQVE
jgi:hypothetical protein